MGTGRAECTYKVELSSPGVRQPLDKILCQFCRSTAFNCVPHEKWRIRIVHEQMRAVRVIKLCFKSKYDKKTPQKAEIFTLLRTECLSYANCFALKNYFLDRVRFLLCL